MALVDKLRSDELRSIESNLRDGLRDQILKSLDERGRAQELIRQQYTGRYPFELLQNANDACVADNGGQVLFQVTDQALIVADQGSGFGADQITAICRLGRSSKDPRKSIGYKGLGFKSVGEISERAQIHSTDVTFGFDASRVREEVRALVGTLDQDQRLPTYAFPFPLEPGDAGSDADLIDTLRSSGYTTVMRLPFRQGVTRSTVEDHVRRTITPRLLLFLDATDSLGLVGTAADFQATVVREANASCTETLLQHEGAVEHWLVYRRLISPIDRRLLDPLGEVWRLVEQVHVAVAVPLDDKGFPAHGPPQTVHVYFPTEETAGLPVILQGDFALELDRRHVARSPEESPYNEWLSLQLADLIGEVAESLAARYTNHASVVAALAPSGQAAAGFGEHVLGQCQARLRQSRFVPLADGRAAVPSDAVLLPASVHAPLVAHRFLDLSGQAGIVIPELESHQPSRGLVSSLGATELKLDSALALLKEPRSEDEVPFYEFLVEWYDAEPRRLPKLLSEVPCVRTLGGGWLPPAARIFFPRQRDDVQFPEGLQVPIAAVPEVDGLRPLLEASGVRPFEWRQLIPEFVLPLLTDPSVQDSTRQAALAALRGYYDTERTGDPRLLQQIGHVLLPVRNAVADVHGMAPANSIYFGHEWIGHDRLERIYGPFNELEFLDIDLPIGQDALQADLAFYGWVGVVGHPRIDTGRLDQSDGYWLETLDRHPHRQKYAEFWTAWKTSALDPMASCDQNHQSSQLFRSSYALDRFPEIVSSRDYGRLGLLWRELAAGWSLYQPALQSEIHCHHGWHNGDRIRYVPSLLRFMLEKAEWVPCIRQQQRVMSRPELVWRLTSDTPPRVAERVAVLDPALDRTESVQVISALGVVDAARPAPGNLATLLRGIAGEWEGDNSDNRGLQLAARWAMRALNDVLDKGGTLTERIPLLARSAGRHVFAEQPFVANDPLLAETFEPVFPILDADRDLRRLHDALSLRILDDEVSTKPIPRGPRPELRQRITDWIRDAAPYLAAVAIDQVPSRRNEVLRGLTRLEVTVCDDLVLRYELDGEARERSEAVSYIAERIEIEGNIIRRRIGTAHLELDPATGEPHWYVFGPQLAVFLGVPNLSDAFALILSAKKADRQQYLAARRVSTSSVDEARVELAMAPQEEREELAELMQMTDPAFGAGDQGGDLDRKVEVPRANENPDGDGVSTPPAPELPLPEIDHAHVSISDGPAGQQANVVTHGVRPGSLGPAGPIDYEQQARIQRRIGRRGEEAAYEAERRRVQQLGLDPAVVRWVSHERELAPYDIESLDDDGQQLYIEVKSTTSDDPHDAFEISEGELLFALRKRSQYCVYRVTEAHLAIPSITRFRDPIGRLNDDRARIRLSGARLTFLPGPDEAGVDQRLRA